MPPKRKATTKATAASKAKKTKAAAIEEVVEEAPPEPGTLKDKIAKLKEADKGKVKTYKPDSFFPYQSQVYLDYDAMLNQTNIGHNNNKFYIIQLLDAAGVYYTWNRWGRVGENGQHSIKPFSKIEDAIKDFEKKFRDKTANKWEDRANFKVKSKKYTLLEMGSNDDEGEDSVDAPAVVSEEGEVEKTILPSSLDKPTQSLLNLIFNNDMFKEALKTFDIDVKKMPLGKLSKTQIAKGFEALEEIEEAIKKKKNITALNSLSSKFYTVIPHSFGRSIPPAIRTAEAVQKKYDMLAVLGDIELAQSMQKDKDAKAKASEQVTVPHPTDENYSMLKCKLNLLKKDSNDFKILKTYCENTQGYSWKKSTLKEIWEVDREGEGDRFAANQKISHRKLLWHGTNVAVVTAILKSGLRIMPHSGGRVGRGIYFASEQNKSAGYVRAAQRKGIMFLTEVALGEVHEIQQDDSSLVKAPAGYDSVLARGQQEPDPSLDTKLKIEGKDIIVPQGNPKKSAESSGNSFWQSEYLVYREDQARIRYLLLFDM